MHIEMTRLQVIGLKIQLLPTIHLLHQLGCVQIDDLATLSNRSVTPLQLTAELRQRQNDLRQLVHRLDSLLAVFVDVGRDLDTASPNSSIQSLSTILQAVEPVAEEVQELVRRKDALLAEQVSLPRYETTLRKLAPLVPASARDPHNISIVLLINASHIHTLQNLTQQIQKLVNYQAEFVEESITDELRAMIIVAPTQYAPELERFLGQEGVSQMELPEEFSGQLPDIAVANLQRRLTEIPTLLSEIEAQLTTLANNWQARFAWWQTALQEQLAEIEILHHLGETERTFVLLGWVPEADFERVKSALETTLTEAIVVQTAPITDEWLEQVPVALDNPALVKPFQSLVGLLSFPGYQDLDPTPLLALGLPLFFGIILGDIGYGAILLGVGWYGRRRSPPATMMRDIFTILMMGSIWAMVFGFLYGEAFGTLGERWGLHPLWLERAGPDQIISLLLFVLAVGAIHITLGLILGIWVAWQKRQRHQLLENTGMLIGLIGLFAGISVLVGWLPDGFMSPAIAILVLGIVILSASMGWLGILLGPIEFIGLLGNILSYLRLAAVGLASVYVALVANELAGNLGSLVLGTIVAILIHALNMVLGAFSPTIHSLRLHYVEFFRKFYQGGGRPFTPFKIETSNHFD